MADAPSRAQKGLQDFLQDLVTDPEVRDAIRTQILSSGPGAAQLFIAAMHQVLGKPRERVEVSYPDMAELFPAVQPSQQERGRERRLRVSRSTRRALPEPRGHAAA
jgi:hypothetical protein